MWRTPEESTPRQFLHSCVAAEHAHQLKNRLKPQVLDNQSGSAGESSFTGVQIKKNTLHLVTEYKFVL